LKAKHGGIDILVNNAAIAFKQAATESFAVQASVTLQTNYYDTKRVCELLFPLLNPGARVVNVSSYAGYLRLIEKATNQTKMEENKKLLCSDTLSVSQLDNLMRDFEVSANSGNHGDHGWPNSTYVVSKIGLSALSRVQQLQLAKDSRKDIVVNHVHPGYVDTDLSSHKGHLTIDRGAESSIYAALLPAGTPIRGAYLWHDCQEVDWVNGPLPAPAKVAIVTGSNKGVGLGIVRGMCKQFKGTVYLTARSEERGLAAVKELEGEGLKPVFHQLDLADEASVLRLRDFIKARHGGIDVLINNAGIAFKQAATESFGVQATVTLKTNYYDTKRVCELLFPLLKSGARVVNVSSSVGFLGHIEKSSNKDKALANKKLLASDTLSVNQLDELMRDFEVSANSGNHGDHGWHNSTYSVSKIGLSALSRIQQRELAKDSRADIVVNHVHPGYVDTDMSSHKGPLTVDRGAESSLYAALLPEGTEVRGAYLWHDCRAVDWINGPLPAMV